MLPALGPLVTSFLTVLLYIGAARFLIARYMPDRPADFGAMCVGVGVLFGIGFGHKGQGDFVFSAYLAGAALALTLSWYLLFRRRAPTR